MSDGGQARSAPVVHGDLVFRFAAGDEEPDIRRLFREIPLGGALQITLEREPNALSADCGLAREHCVLIAHDKASGEAVGVGERTTRDLYIDGVAREVPYYGGLRVRPGYRRRIGALRKAFRLLRAMDDGTASLAFASITSDNSNARRLLEAGLPGLPIFQPYGEFSTFALRPRKASLSSRVTRATRADYPLLASFLQRANARFQFAECWSQAALEGLAEFGLQPHHFLIARNEGEIAGCLAVWDQRGMRQTVIRKYPPHLRALRPLVNIAAPLLGVPALPPEGQRIEQMTLSHLALSQDDPEIFADLLRAGLSDAAERGGRAAVLGFASARPLRKALLHRFRAIEYRTSLCLVYWPETAGLPSTDRLPHPELGLL